MHFIVLSFIVNQTNSSTAYALQPGAFVFPCLMLKRVHLHAHSTHRTKRIACLMGTILARWFQQHGLNTVDEYFHKVTFGI